MINVKHKLPYIFWSGSVPSEDEAYADIPHRLVLVTDTCGAYVFRLEYCDHDDAMGIHIWNRKDEDASCFVDVLQQALIELAVEKISLDINEIQFDRMRK